MKKQLLGLIAALLLLPGGLYGQTVKLPKEVSGDPGTIVIVTAETNCTELKWVALDPGLSIIPPSLLKDSRSAVCMAGRPGRFRILAYGAVKDIASEPAICTIVLGDAPPVPPIPPGPDPGPTPGPSPIPVDGLRVLIIYETAEVGGLPRPQLAILTAGPVRDYLHSHCAKGPDLKTAEWRIWDKDVVTTNETKLWQDAMARPRKQIPWLIISTGKNGYEGPLPANVDEMIALLKKYGG